MVLTFGFATFDNSLAKSYWDVGGGSKRASFTLGGMSVESARFGTKLILVNLEAWSGW